jgi:predicted ATPase
MPTPQQRRRLRSRSLQLTEVKLRNIRAIKDQTIPLKPLTVLVGGNSAGKSTVLKSLLLLAQAQRESLTPGDVGLNGKLVSFDKFDSIVRSGSGEAATIDIELKFSVSEAAQWIYTTRGSNEPALFQRPRGTSTDELYELMVSLGQHPQTLGSAEIRQIGIRSEESVIALSRSTSNDRVVVQDGSPILNLVGKASRILRRDRSEVEVAGTVLDGVVPRQIAVRRSLAELIVNETLKAYDVRIQHGSRRYLSPLAPSFVLLDVVDGVVEKVRTTEEVVSAVNSRLSMSSSAADVYRAIVTEYLRSCETDRLVGLIEEQPLRRIRDTILAEIEGFWLGMMIPELMEIQGDQRVNLIDAREATTRDKNLVNRLPSRDSEFDSRTRTGFDSLQARNRMMIQRVRYAAHLMSLEFDEDPVVSALYKFGVGWGSPLTQISEEDRAVGFEPLADFLLQQVHYIGPLRRGPESVTTYRMRGAPNQVGTEGENLAYLLSLNPTVSCPVWQGRPGTSEVDVVEMSLQEALSYWMQQLNLADRVSGREEAGIGDTIRLKMKGVDAELSPNDVGVGVSQAMPVLAAVLMARPGDMIVAEQPELHLHPNAQLALADFFLAATRSGRRLLVESHSEHFLSRIRRRSVETSETDEGWISQNVGFVFAEPEQEGTDSGATFRQVLVTASGDVDSWPKGFFDQGPGESRQIFLIQQEKNS